MGMANHHLVQMCRVVFLLACWSSMILPAMAACESRVDFDVFDEALSAAEEAYASKRRDQIDNAMERAYHALECLEFLITPERAARFHGVVAMQQWSIARFGVGRLALMACRAADQNYEFPDVIAQDDPIREALVVTRTVTPSRKKVKKPASGSFRFDGREAADRPHSLPTVYQKLDTLGSSRVGAYVWPVQDLPVYTLLKHVKKQKKYTK